METSERQAPTGRTSRQTQGPAAPISTSRLPPEQTRGSPAPCTGSGVRMPDTGPRTQRADDSLTHFDRRETPGKDRGSKPPRSSTNPSKRSSALRRRRALSSPLVSLHMGVKTKERRRDSFLLLGRLFLLPLFPCLLGALVELGPGLGKVRDLHQGVPVPLLPARHSREHRLLLVQRRQLQ